MSLLEIYLGAVGMYLAKDPDKNDILAELRGHLEAKMEERRAQVSRELTETEQQAVLTEFGAPFVVATRYGRTGPSFGFGPFQLISPAAFPVYVGVLLFVLAVNVVVTSVQILVTGAPALAQLHRLLITILVLFVVFTVVFAGVDFFLRRSARRQRGAPESWLFWTPYLKYVPRWYSASGLVFMGTLALLWFLWWSLWPQFPALLVGQAVRPLILSPAWRHFQLILLGLLALGIAQRAFSLVRPDLNLLPWVVRLGINILCAALLYPILHGGSFIVVPSGAAVSADTVDLARQMDAMTRGYIRGFGFYWALNVLWIALVCAGHIVYRIKRRRSPQE